MARAHYRNIITSRIYAIILKIYNQPYKMKAENLHKINQVEQALALLRRHL